MSDTDKTPRVWVEVRRQRDGVPEIDRFTAESAIAKVHRRGGGRVAIVRMVGGRDESGRGVLWKIYGPDIEIAKFAGPPAGGGS